MKYNQFYQFISNKRQAGWVVKGEGDSAYKMRSLPELEGSQCISGYRILASHLRVDQQYSDVNTAMGPWHLTLMFKNELDEEHKMHCYFGWNGQVAVEQVGIVGQTALCKAVTAKLNEAEGPFKAQIDSMSALMAQWRTFCEKARQEKQDKIAELEDLDAQGKDGQWQAVMTAYIQWLEKVIMHGAELEMAEVKLCKQIQLGMKSYVSPEPDSKPVAQVYEAAMNRNKPKKPKGKKGKGKKGQGKKGQGKKGQGKKGQGKGNCKVVMATAIDLKNRLNSLRDQLTDMFDWVVKFSGDQDQLVAMLPDLLRISLEHISLLGIKADQLDQPSQESLSNCRQAGEKLQESLVKMIVPLFSIPGGCFAVGLLFGQKKFEPKDVPGMHEWWSKFCGALCAGEADLSTLKVVLCCVPDALSIEMASSAAEVMSASTDGGGAAGDTSRETVTLVQQCYLALLATPKSDAGRKKILLGLLKWFLYNHPVVMLTSKIDGLPLALHVSDPSSPLYREVLSSCKMREPEVRSAIAQCLPKSSRYNTINEWLDKLTRPVTFGASELCKMTSLTDRKAKSKLRHKHQATVELENQRESSVSDCMPEVNVMALLRSPLLAMLSCVLSDLLCWVEEQKMTVLGHYRADDAFAFNLLSSVYRKSLFELFSRNAISTVSDGEEFLCMKKHWFGIFVNGMAAHVFKVKPFIMSEITGALADPVLEMGCDRLPGQQPSKYAIAMDIPMFNRKRASFQLKFENLHLANGICRLLVKLSEGMDDACVQHSIPPSSPEVRAFLNATLPDFEAGLCDLIEDGVVDCKAWGALLHEQWCAQDSELLSSALVWLKSLRIVLKSLFEGAVHEVKHNKQVGPCGAQLLMLCKELTRHSVMQDDFARMDIVCDIMAGLFNMVLGLGEAALSTARARVTARVGIFAGTDLQSEGGARAVPDTPLEGGGAKANPK